MSSKTAVDLIIKLGGSAITEKDQFETLKPDSLKEAAILIQECFKKNMKMIIVHGAGSFGHHQAKQYSVNSGFVHLDSKDGHQARMGFCRTHRSVSKLNSLVAGSLVDNDIPVVSCSPCSSWLTCNKIVAVSGSDMVAQLIDAGFVPVLHGDTVRDTQIGGCILSGDTIIKTLCDEFVVDHVVFVMDVAGVFDRPPDQTGAVLLPRISVNQDGRLAYDISTSVSPHDVTGGIKLKIQTAVDVVTSTEGRTRVHVCKLGSDSSHKLCLKEDCDESSIEGTEVSLVK